MKPTLYALGCAACLAAAAWRPAQAQTMVAGGDVSLIPAYEAAGDVWLDASGRSINTGYADGLITYLKDVAGWNAVRLRLFVDPTLDDDAATCQDLDYVRAFAVRIKAAGLKWLLDLHYSDSWADPSYQVVPASWGFGASTPDATVAAKVYSYTTDVLQTLAAAGVAPDYVQVGNEISYGMLLRSDKYGSKASASRDYCNISSYNASAWTYLAALLTQGSRAVREQCPAAKVIIHIERTASASTVRAYFQNLRRAGLADGAYDVVGLSYYPFWHGGLDLLSATLADLRQSLPDKEVQVVETAWCCNTYYPGDAKYAASKFPWALGPQGQAAFLTDLVACLRQHPNVTGLYYWQPEECGNGYKKTVMADWINRGFWEPGWQVQSHRLISADALMTLRTLLPADAALPAVGGDAAEAPAGPAYDLMGRRLSGAPAVGQIGVQAGRRRLVVEP